MRGLAGRGVEQAGDAEVKQLDAPLAGDQHIGRLQVAVHHEVAVRIGHRVADLDEQREPLRQRGRVRRTPVDQVVADHQLHHHVGPAIGAHVAVEQARDAGVVEPRHDLPLGAKARRLRDGIEPHQLDRHLLVELAVGTRSAVDLAHAATPQQCVDAPGPEPCAGCEAGRCGGCTGCGGHARKHVGGGPVEQFVVTIELRGEGLQLQREARIGARDAGDRSATLRGGQCDQFVERGIGAGPARRCGIGGRGNGHGAGSVSSAAASAPSSRRSQARALSQSRRTVRSLRPNAAAVSSSP